MEKKQQNLTMVEAINSNNYLKGLFYAIAIVGSPYIIGFMSGYVLGTMEKLIALF